MNIWVKVTRTRYKDNIRSTTYKLYFYENETLLMADVSSIFDELICSVPEELHQCQNPLENRVTEKRPKSL